jgi:hypothetical protein
MASDSERVTVQATRKREASESQISRGGRGPEPMTEPHHVSHVRGWALPTPPGSISKRAVYHVGGQLQSLSCSSRGDGSAASHAPFRRLHTSTIIAVPSNLSIHMLGTLVALRRPPPSGSPLPGSFGGTDGGTRKPQWDRPNPPQHCHRWGHRPRMISGRPL